jgi:hypothetical protein
MGRDSQSKTFRCRSSLDALRQICDALADFGDMLNISHGETRMNLSAEACNAVVEAYYSDVECVGATRLAHGHFTIEEAKTASTKLLPLARELHKAASGMSKRRADRNLERIEKTMAWLYSNAE